MIKKTTITIILLLSASILFLSSCSSNDCFYKNGFHKAEADLPAAETVVLTDQTDIPPAEGLNAILKLPRVGVYAGIGSWDENVLVLKHFLNKYGYEWSLFDENVAVASDLNELFDLVWFPGGFAAEYSYYINNHHNIRLFIDNGGIFVGSCAGAYYAADILRWLFTEDNQPLIIDYPLKIFDGIATGPLLGLINWGDKASINLDAGHSANSGFEEMITMYYLDGPYFEPYHYESIEVLARYSVNNEPAVIAGRLGDGKYLLLGPHPEFGSYSSESSGFNLFGEDGAQWPWLHSALLWLIQW